MSWVEGSQFYKELVRHLLPFDAKISRGAASCLSFQMTEQERICKRHLLDSRIKNKTRTQKTIWADTLHQYLKSERQQLANLRSGRQLRMSAIPLVLHLPEMFI